MQAEVGTKCMTKTQIFDNERDNIFQANNLAKHLSYIHRQWVRHKYNFYV